jgi:dTDP-4-dehydrorhamnose reductase
MEGYQPMSAKVAILGNTGMLGSMVEKILSRQMDLHVNGFGRESIELFPRSLNSVGAKLTELLGFDTSWVINCMGATKPYFDSASDLTIPLYANAIFPHQLAKWAELMHTNVIHITTDCVYDGHIGRYDERAPHSAQDMYGKSKSLGEPDNCMIIRTSIIGPETEGRSKHLLSWVKSQDEKSTNGYVNHFWNGVTSLELAYIIADVICSYYYEEETFHIFSSDISKYEMINQIAEVYGLNIDLTPVKTSISCDRRLRTVKSLNDLIGPKSFIEMIEELKEHEDVEYG